MLLKAQHVRTFVANSLRMKGTEQTDTIRVTLSVKPRRLVRWLAKRLVVFVAN
jgi:hypothetical protein